MTLNHYYLTNVVGQYYLYIFFNPLYLCMNLWLFLCDFIHHSYWGSLLLLYYLCGIIVILVYTDCSNFILCYFTWIFTQYYHYFYVRLFPISFIRMGLLPLRLLFMPSNKLCYYMLESKPISILCLDYGYC